MQALTIDPTRRDQVTFTADYPRPAAAEGEVLIRVGLAGICATDLELARGYMGFRGVPGHEFVGTVAAGPEELVGQRVVAEINCPCSACAMCRCGRFNHCTRRTVLGIQGRDGAFAQYLTMPAGNCHRVPENVTDSQAVFAEPLAAAAHVLDAVKLTPGTRVALLGSGRLGLLTALVLGRTAAELTVIGRNSRTLGLCRGWGLHAITVDDLPGHAVFDVVVDCTGAPEGLRQALRLCVPCGTIVLKSTYAEAEPVDLAPVVINEVRIVGSRCGAFPRALALLARGDVRVDELVSAIYPLGDGVAAFAAAKRPENIKVLLRPDPD